MKRRFSNFSLFFLFFPFFFFFSLFFFFFSACVAHLVERLPFRTSLQYSIHAGLTLGMTWQAGPHSQRKSEVLLRGQEVAGSNPAACMYERFGRCGFESHRRLGRRRLSGKGKSVGVLRVHWWRGTVEGPGGTTFGTFGRARSWEGLFVFFWGRWMVARRAWEGHF